MSDFAEKEKDFQEAFNSSYDYWFKWIEEAHRDFKFTIDSPWTETDKQYFRDQNREILNFNIIRRVVNMISGYEIKNRLALKVAPAEGSDDKIASQLTGIIMPIMESRQGYEVLSDAFEFGALITGLNLVELYSDRKGDIQFSRKPYNKFLLDPGFTKRDLTDCGHIIIHEEGMLTSEVKSLIPGKDALIDNYAKETESQITLPYSAYQSKARDGGKRCNYSAFWEQTTKKVKMIANRQSGQKMVWTGDKEELDEVMIRYGMQLVSWDDYIDTVELSCFVNGRCVHKGPDPNKIDCYPFIGVFGYWYPEYDDQSVKLQGIVRSLRDPQKEVSKRLSKILDIIDSQLSSGLMAEEGSLTDPNDIHASGQGKGLWLKPGALSSGAVQRITSPDIPSGLFQLNNDLQKFVNDIAGVNDSLFGSDELKAQVSGYLMKLRQGSALICQGGIFNRLRFSKQDLTFKLAKFIQKNYSPTKIQRIINETPSPQFQTEDLTNYDLIPQEGILTETQQQMFYTELRQAKAEGAPITWSMIFGNAPIQMKDKLLKMIAQEEQRQQQMQAEQMKEKQLLDQMRTAKIAADVGRAKEREANVNEHHADAALARVKTMKELENMDHDKQMDLLDRVIALENIKMSNKKPMTKR